MKKDKVTTIRINGEVLEILKNENISVQKIVDIFIEKHFKKTVKIEKKIDFKKELD